MGYLTIKQNSQLYFLNLYEYSKHTISSLTISMILLKTIEV